MWTRRKFLGATGQGIGAAIGCGMISNLEAAAEAEPARTRPARVPAALPPAEAAVASARAVLERLLGERAASFDLSWMPKQDGCDVYELAAAGGRVAIKGSSGVALCRGAYTYLRRQCGVMVTWSGRRLELPERFPDAAPERVACPYRFTQYMNPCTFGYTAAFWDWERWQRELDWMALHGINMPLAMEGQEAIWQKVWLSLGMRQEEVDQWHTGPAQLPWHRMGNINQFEGPLPQEMIQQKKELQKKILAQMRELGMMPVAPGFAGFVPQDFLRLYPKARTFTLLWSPRSFKTMPRSSKTFILHPGETELYKEIGRRFIQEYKAEFGEVSYYLADSFNEMDVPVTAGRRYEDLALFGSTVYEGIKAGDPNGTWVMQGWLFVHDPQFWDSPSIEALLSRVPSERMVIIDFANDIEAKPGSKYAPDQWKRHNAFYGKQWINGMAHTFGGNNQVKGNLPIMARQPAEALHDPKRGNLAGWGFCPEGIENNEVVYELMTDMGWSDKAIDLPRWIREYGMARYGAFPPAMEEAWKLLLESAYSTHIWMTKHGWQRAPSLQPKAIGVDSGEKFQQATELFLSCAERLQASAYYRNDLAELVAQSAGGAVDARLAAAGAAHQAGRGAERDTAAREALAMLRRIDALMQLRPDRRLSSWTEAARSWATSPAAAAGYDENARLLLTEWGWSELWDYANRVWAGLIRDYYIPRWEVFLAGLRGESSMSVEIWQETWLSTPYAPSAAAPVADLVAECRSMLSACKGWRSGQGA